MFLDLFSALHGWCLDWTILDAQVAYAVTHTWIPWTYDHVGLHGYSDEE